MAEPIVLDDLAQEVYEDNLAQINKLTNKAVAVVARMIGWQVASEDDMREMRIARGRDGRFVVFDNRTHTLTNGEVVPVVPESTAEGVNIVGGREVLEDLGIDAEAVPPGEYTVDELLEKE